LLVIADGEDVTMFRRELTNDGVLNAIEILKFVDEHDVPAATDFGADLFDPQKLGGFQNQRVEVGHVSTRHDALVGFVNLFVAPSQGLAAKAESSERIQNRLDEFSRNLEAAKDRLLVRIVSDSESQLQADLVAEFTQQLGAKGVNGSALDALRARPQLTPEPFGYLTGGLVGESKNANPAGVYTQAVDQKPYSLDQTERLAGAGTGEHEQRLGAAFYCRQLGSRRNTRARGRRDFERETRLAECSAGRATCRKCQSPDVR